MPGQLNLRTIRLLCRRLKIPGDDEPSRIGDGNSPIENTIVAACPERVPPRLCGRGAALGSASGEPRDLSIRQAQLFAIRRSENIYVKIKGAAAT